MIILLYVDELLITGSSKDEIASLKGAMNQAFSMTDLGLLSQFLGLEIAQTKAEIKVHQSKYALDLLNKFKMKDCKPSKSPFLSRPHASDRQGRCDSKLYQPGLRAP